MSDNVAIIIPARLKSTRLPNKPLADINGLPMIIHVLNRATAANIGDVYVACCEQEVYNVVTEHKGKAILTNPDHPSGTDRIYEAAIKTGKKYDYIINLQGDLPSIDPRIIKTSYDILKTNPNTDIATLTAKIVDEEEKTNPNVVKVVMAIIEQNKYHKALYFTRATAPFGEGDLYHHIGLYAYKFCSLEKFVKLKPSTLEIRERLEQLRALENGMTIDVAIINSIPFGVDTEEDLLKMRKILQTTN